MSSFVPCDLSAISSILRWRLGGQTNQKKESNSFINEHCWLILNSN